MFLCVATTCTPPRWQRQRRLRPHPTPYAETEAEAHNERILRCWARTKQIDVANAGGRVLPLFFAISPCACGPPCCTTRHLHTHTQTYTLTLTIRRCCVLFSIRVYRILFSSPAIVPPPSTPPPHLYYTCMHTYIL